MKWRPIAGVVLRQFYLMRSSPTRVLPLFAWVAIDIVLWGFISRYLDRVSGAAAGVNFVGQLLGAVLFWDFFTRVMQGVTIAFFEDVWSRNFLNIFAAPLTIVQYISGLVLTSIATSTVGLLAMLVTSSLFGRTMFEPGLITIAFVLVLFLFGTALGICACALVLRFGPASEWLVWPIPALLAPFAGVFYPLSTLPAWMQVIARGLPPAYVFEDLRAIVAGQAVSAHGSLTALALACVQIVLATWLFMAVHRSAVRHGLLARYSAESVT